MILATTIAAALWLGAAAPTPTPIPVATLPPRGASPAPQPAPSVSATPPLSADQMRKIDEIAISELEQQAAPGLALAVVRDGRVVYSRGYGFASIELQQTVRDASLFEIGSITKQFTAADILLLVEDGRINLQMPLSTFVPDFPRAKEITLRDLLTMRSGIPDYTDQPGFDKLALKPATPADILATVKQLPLDFDPGTRWEYSNTNYVLLGMVIERASGESYGSSVNDKIFRPLNMIATQYGNAGASSPDVATGYSFDGARMRPATPWDLDWAFAAGGLVSNALELAVWDTALLQGKVVNLADLREMWTPITLKDGTRIPYGYGWTIESLYGHREIDDNGDLPGYSGRNAIFPNDKFDVIVLANTQAFDAGPVVNRIFAQFFPPTPAQVAAEHQGDDVALGRARDVFRKLASGTLDQSALTGSAAKRLTSTLRSQAKAQLGKLGSPKRFDQTDKYLLGDETVYSYRLVFKQGAVGLVVAFDAAGKVGTLAVEPL